MAAPDRKPTPSQSAAGKRERRRLRDLYPRSLVTNWLVPALLVAGIVLVATLAFHWLDAVQTGERLSLKEIFFLNSPEDVGSALGNLSEVLVAVLGLVITVVAIVVQLASQRYTPKLVDLFIADRTNISFFVLMVVTALYSVVLIYATPHDFLPSWGALALVALSTLVLSLLIPYFAHVFYFLTPDNIINVIRGNGQRAMQTALDPKLKQPEMRKLQNQVAMAMEQISDISLSAVSQMDRNVALLSIRSLRDVMVDHLLIKRRMTKRWFVPSREHFPAISTEFFQELYTGRNWVEMKGFLDMDLIFKNAVRDMPDAVSAIATSTKIVGLYALKLRDEQVLNDCVQFFNTFLRHAINARNPKAIYNLFYQYRLLAEEVLSANPPLAEKIAFYFKYYGQTAQAYNIPLILITACFDLSTLLRRAYDRGVPNLQTLLTTFLEADDNPATQSNEFDLRSVRKAQLMFAAYLLSQGDTHYVHQIFVDTRSEPKDRMEQVRKEMMAVKDRKFWEVTDRGVDFFYMDEDQKRYLDQFFTQYLDPYYAEHEEPQQQRLSVHTA